jgi:pilus assembly protein Flp/PilA
MEIQQWTGGCPSHNTQRKSPVSSTPHPQRSNVMLKLCTRVKNLFTSKKEEGATMVEYAIMVALIAVVCIVSVRALGLELVSVFLAVTTALTGV